MVTDCMNVIYFLQHNPLNIGSKIKHLLKQWFLIIMTLYVLLCDVTAEINIINI